MTILRATLQGVPPSATNGSHKHWTAAAKSRSEWRTTTRETLLALWRSNKGPPVHLVVELRRFGPRELDGDNCAASLKPVRDGVADWLGVPDHDPNIRWVVTQTAGGKGSAKSARVEIIIRQAPPREVVEATRGLLLGVMQDAEPAAGADVLEIIAEQWRATT